MIIVKLKGGMGNQMFQYAVGRALSLKHNVPLGLDLSFLLDRTPRPKFTFRDYDLDVYNIKTQIVPQSKVPFLHRKYFKGRLGLFQVLFCQKFLKLKGNEKYFHFNPSILSLESDAYLDGYWQSPRYFQEVEDIIRKDFNLKNPPSQNIQSLMLEIKSQNSLCIHVRRVDFIANSLHEIVDKEYYNKGVEYISKLTTLDKIYVFSDDIEWCKNNLKFEFPTMFVGNEYAGKKGEGHSFLMSACRYFIIPNSTFSWWSAWLGSYKDKIVIAPKKWFTDDCINTDDLVPKGWVRL